MILVTGATGQLGRAIIQQLLRRTTPHQIAVFVRDAEKTVDWRERGVDIRVGDYDNTAALDTAMRGIEKVLLIAGTNEEQRVQQHRRVVNAANQVGVHCIAYTSRTLKDRTTMANKLMEGHFQTEDYIKASGMAYAIFRNVLYMDSILLYVGDRGLATGIHLPAGHGKVAYALRSDMGEAIANWLVAGKCDNQVYKLTGSAAYSFDDIAAMLTDLTGKKVTYTAIENAAFAAHMQARGVPEMMVQRMFGFMTDIKNGQEEEVSSDLEQLLGHKPTSLRDGLKTLFKI